MKKNIIILIAAMFAAFTLSAQTPTYFGIGIANPVGNLHVHSLEEPPLPPAPDPDLPQMPSAAEVEADGADLGEMNRLLLQKVEELTLYIIDLQKQIYELKSNN